MTNVISVFEIQTGNPNIGQRNIENCKKADFFGQRKSIARSNRLSDLIPMARRGDRIAEVTPEMSRFGLFRGATGTGSATDPLNEFQVLRILGSGERRRARRPELIRRAKRKRSDATPVLHLRRTIEGRCSPPCTG